MTPKVQWITHHVTPKIALSTPDGNVILLTAEEARELATTLEHLVTTGPTTRGDTGGYGG